MAAKKAAPKGAKAPKAAPFGKGKDAPKKPAEKPGMKRGAPGKPAFGRFKKDK